MNGGKNSRQMKDISKEAIITLFNRRNHNVIAFQVDYEYD